MNSGKIYVIAQRPVLTIENLNIDGTNIMNPFVTFEIHQRGNKAKLECSMPIYQTAFGAEGDQWMHLGVTYTYPKPENPSGKPPFFSLSNFLFKTEKEETIWMSPEKFLYHYWREAIEANVIGDITAFTRYQVHYLGKATEQDIISRLTGHSHLQDILSVEYPFHYGSLPTDEVCILLFRFFDNVQLSTFGPDDDIKEAAELLMGNNPIQQNTIYLDAEKALINALSRSIIGNCTINTLKASMVCKSTT